MNELALAPRPLPVIEAELDLLAQDTWQKELALLANYIEVGRRLEEVKAQLPHGEWMPWLENRGYPQTKAVKMMKLFRGYGTEQQSLFGSEAKSKAFENLGFQKLVQLLAIDDYEEREQFVADHDVETMSTRELDKALKERNEELKWANARTEAAEKRNAELEAEYKKAHDALRKASAKAMNLEDELKAAQLSAQSAEDEHTRLLQELEELRRRPVEVAVEVDTEAVDAARKAAVAEMTEKVNKAKAGMRKENERRKAAEEALADAQRELEDLKAREPQTRELTPEERQAMTADAVEQARAEDAKRIREMEKQLAAADPDIAAFNAAFQTWQDAFGKMATLMGRIYQADQAKAAKLRNAVHAALSQMGGDTECS